MLEGFVGLTVFVFQVGEEIELGVARDLGMSGEEFGELGVVAGHVLLVGEERRVVGDDGGERGAEAQDLDELALGGGDVLARGDGGADGARLSRSGDARALAQRRERQSDKARQEWQQDAAVSMIRSLVWKSVMR